MTFAVMCPYAFLNPYRVLTALNVYQDSFESPCTYNMCTGHKKLKDIKALEKYSKLKVL